MRIVLLRHGKPDMVQVGKVHSSEMEQWIEDYNQAGLPVPQDIPLSSIEVVQQSAVVVCSDLRRSIDSAQALGVSKIDYTDAVYREAGLPFAAVSGLKLPVNIWLLIYRVLWFFGYSTNSESLAEAKLRALLIASNLRKFAKEKGTVVFVGHGFINKFVAKVLLEQGWTGPNNPGNQYWSFGVYEST